VVNKVFIIYLFAGLCYAFDIRATRRGVDEFWHQRTNDGSSHDFRHRLPPPIGQDDLPDQIHRSLALERHLSTRKLLSLFFKI
jgi:hypothetical protein